MPIDIELGDPFPMEPRMPEQDLKLFELQFSFKKGNSREKPEDMFALIAAPNEVLALQSLLGVWKPGNEISNMQVREITKYFQVHLDWNSEGDGKSRERT